MSLDMAASGSSSDAGEASMVLYTRGEPSDTFTLILQGKALIRTGAQTVPPVCTLALCVVLIIFFSSATCMRSSVTLQL